MSNSPFTVKRIANLLPPSFRDAYPVPPEAVGVGFTSEVVTLAAEVSFVNELDRTIAGLHFVEAGVRAEAAGYAALFLNTVGDYGLRELRAAVRIPVVGAGQATFQVAAGLADRFGVLTVWPTATRSMYQRLIEDYGHAGRCVGVRHVLENEELATVTDDDGFLSQMSRSREAAVSRLMRGAVELLDQGADAIALGCSCMAPVRVELQDRLGVPVVDPIVAGHKTAEMLVTMDLTHREVPIPSGFVGSVPAMLTGASSSARDVDICGDTCSVMASPATL